MIDFVQQLWQFDQHLPAFVARHGAWVYGLLFLVVFLELGILPCFFLPGNPMVFVCGAMCATGTLQALPVALALWSAMVLGSLVNYATGRGLGRGIETWHWRWPDRDALERTHAFYERRGGLSFLLSPYLPVIRTCAPFVGGVARMTLSHFALFVMIGAALWVLPLLAAGYVFGNLPGIQEHFAALVWGGIGLGLALLVAASLWRLRRARVPAASPRR